MSNASSSSRVFARALAVTVLSVAVVLSSASVSFAAGVTASSIKTGDTGNGKIDSVTIKFNVPMDRALTPKIASAPGQPGFYVDGYAVTSAQWVEAAPTPATTLRLNLAEGAALDSHATPHVTYMPGGDAISQLGIESDEIDTDATDGAGPVLIAARVHDAPGAGLFNTVSQANPPTKGDELTLIFSEPAKLTGADRLTRWSNLEKAIQFNNISAEGSGCIRDGQGLNDFFNFPQPVATNPTGPDAILEPANESALASTFRIQYLAGTQRPNATFPGVPHGCWIGVEPGTVNPGSLIRDAAGNDAVRQASESSAVVQPKPVPVDAALVADALDPVITRDGVGGPRDGVIDAVELKFDQAIDLNTIRSESGSPLNVPTVSLGGVNASVDVASIRHPVDGGGNDVSNVVVLPFSLPQGIAWDTGIRPAVRYTKPGACSADTTANGIKAKVPSGGTWRACVGSFDFSEAFDRAAPLVTSAVTTDADGNGRIDRVTVNFSEAISTGTPAGWTLNGQPATGFTPGVGNRSATIPISEGPAGDTGSTATVAYASQPTQQTRDAWNNQVVATSVNATDGAGPRIVSASVHDLDANGRLDRAVLTYSEPIVDPASGDASSFRVGGVSASAFAPGTGDDPSDDTLTLAIDVPGTGAQTIEFNGTSIKDAANNLAGGQVLDASLVTDQAPAIASISVDPGAPLSAGLSTVTVTYSEPMATTSAPTVSLAGTAVNPKTDAHTNGFRTDDTSVWEGTVAVAESACATPTGCAVDLTASGATDVAGITQRSKTLATEIDTIAPQAPTLGTFSVQQTESAPANTVNMFTRGIALGVGVVPGDAAGGHAEIVLDGNVLPGSQGTQIPASASSASGSKSFADLNALRSAMTEGAHTLTARVCDDAMNCADTTESVEILVDTVAVDVELVEPIGGGIVGGGEARTITWDGDGTATDLDHVELDLLTPAATPIDHSHTLADGSITWTVPAIDVASARVRVGTIDASGNKATNTSGPFAIDSTAPVVTMDQRETFLPAGGTSTVRWSATDATIDQATDPITIEYTLDGKSWQPINGGSYSRANDGAEAFKVPNASTFSMKLRVRATDATGKSTTVGTGRLVSGVAGYVASSSGHVYAFGSSDGRTNETRRGGNWVAGMALAPNGTTGYTMSGNGTLYPFSIGSASTPRKFVLKLPAGSARDLVLTGRSRGYVVDKNGRIHRFGRAPSVTSGRPFRCDCARAIVLTGDGTGGYVLSAYGKLVPFAIGKNAMPRSLVKRNLFRSKAARDVVLSSNGRSGHVLTHTGKVVAFGGRAVKSAGVRRGRDAQALIGVTDTGGYWVDGKGVLRPFGSAIGYPARTSLGKRTARGAAAA